MDKDAVMQSTFKHYQCRGVQQLPVSVRCKQLKRCLLFVLCLHFAEVIQERRLECSCLRLGGVVCGGPCSGIARQLRCAFFCYCSAFCCAVCCVQLQCCFLCLFYFCYFSWGLLRWAICVLRAFTALCFNPSKFVSFPLLSSAASTPASSLLLVHACCVSAAATAAHRCCCCSHCWAAGAASWPWGL